MLFTTAFRPFVGGSEIAIEEIIRHMPNIFFDILTPHYNSKLLKEECGDNFTIHRIGFGSSFDKFLFPIIGCFFAKKLSTKNNYNFNHAFQASYGAGASWLFKVFNKKIPMILTLQEGKNLDKQNFMINFFRKLIIKKSDKITAISGYLKKYAEKFNSKSQIFIIPNGVDVASFSRDFSYGDLSSLKDQLNIKPDEKVIVSISRLVPKNGIKNLIKAFGIFLQDGKLPCKLLLIGDGQQKAELEELASELKIKDKIIFVGQVNYSDLPKYLKISDIFVRPSLSEGLGSAFLEAMAAGVPIIGSKVGGIPDFLTDLKTGLFCDPKNSEDIAEKIKMLLSNEAMRKEIIQNSAELVRNKYDWSNIARQYRDIYLK